MATHYLIDAHNPTLLSSEINDVRQPLDGISEVNGSFVVPVPDIVKLADNPTDLADLLTKKYAGILAEYPGYSSIVYDDCLDATDFTVEAGEGFALGDRGNIGVGSGKTLRTAVVPLGSTVSQFVILVEAYRWTMTNTPAGRIVRRFEEDHVTDLGLSVSTNGGTDFQVVINGQLNQMGATPVGTNLVVEFAPPSVPGDDTPIFIASWAVIY